MAQKENILTRVEDFIVWFLPHLEHFPRNYKFLIGDRAVKVLLDILEDLADAYYSKEKLDKLKRANVALEKLRRILSVCVRMKFLTPKQLAFASNRLYEIGADLGGWIKQQGAKGEKGREGEGESGADEHPATNILDQGSSIH